MRRDAGTGKLLQLQLTVATQLYGVAESLSQVASATSGSGGGSKGGAKGGGAKGGAKGGAAAGGTSFPISDEALQHEREVRELRRALKRQQLLTSDAHRQLLELSTRRKPMGAASSDDVNALRTAVAEQEMRRMMVEARCDELQAQVRLFEEQGLRMRLHPQPPPQMGAAASLPASARASPLTSPIRSMLPPPSRATLAPSPPGLHSAARMA